VLSDGDGNPRGIFDGSGNFLVGKTAASGANTEGVELRPTLSTFTSDGGTAIYASRLTNDGNVIAFERSSSPCGSISVTTSSTSYNTSSDYRLKENVVDMTGATKRLKQLNPVRFNFIVDADKTVDGFLAHEVADIVPEAVHGVKDEVDADGNAVYQGIDQSKLVPLLVATIQELEARIAALESN
jgi:hypothetical protein